VRELTALSRDRLGSEGSKRSCLGLGDPIGFVFAVDGDRRDRVAFVLDALEDFLAVDGDALGCGEPNLTCRPCRLNTVKVTWSPIMSFSPTRRVRISMRVILF